MKDSQINAIDASFIEGIKYEPMCNIWLFQRK